MSFLLLRPFLYLRIKHASFTLTWINWGIPATVTAIALVAGSLEFPDLNYFHAGGMFDRLLSFVQNLPGFFIAALAAVATFGRADLDQLMPGTPPKVSVLYHGKPKVVELTRRRFLSLIFSYLTALNIAITLALITGLPMVDHVHAALLPKFVGAVRLLAGAPIVFFTAQMMTVTFWGLYYLGERVHTPD
jgi:hypothetical protein